jgi:hypothetical protein
MLERCDVGEQDTRRGEGTCGSPMGREWLHDHAGDAISPKVKQDHLATGARSRDPSLAEAPAMVVNPIVAQGESWSFPRLDNEVVSDQ